jgi:alcohol dehydrogenase
LVPTTAGTGSEVTPIAVFSDDRDQVKKGIVSTYLLPSAAILDPALTLGLPKTITAYTGMDALVHAIEAYTSINANGLTDTLALRAIQLLFGNVLRAYVSGDDIEARSKMLEGSLFAGMAFANAGVTAVHAFAYPLGGAFHHIPHGLANSVMLLPVMRFNIVGNEQRFGSVARTMGVCGKDVDDRHAAKTGLAAIGEMLAKLGIPSRLRDLNVPRATLPIMAEGVMKVTRLLANNPRSITLKDAEEIYANAW